MSITSSQASIVDDLFIRTADENYITARWCSIHDLNTDFAWLAVHALEKYLKAVLLYNGRQAKTQGHKIIELYEEVKGFAADLLPVNLDKPPTLEIAHWCERTPEGFLQHLYGNGNADNRYLIFGHDTRREDLHMLDIMVFAIRRLICSLDEPMMRGSHIPKHLVIPTHRKCLKDNPEFGTSHSMPLDELVRDKKDSELRFAALNLNLSFAPVDYPHKGMRSGNSSRNPVIGRRVLDPLKRSDESQVKDGIETASWLLDNVWLPGEGKKRKGVAKQIEDALEKAKARLARP